MAPHDTRWEGTIEERVSSHEKQITELWERFHSMDNRVFVVELVIERNKGRVEGSKATLIFIGSLIGSAIGALITWLVGKI